HYAPFITVNPSIAAQQALVSQSTYFVNFAGVPYVPANVSAVLDDREQNATAQQIDGIDLTAQDTWPLLGGELDALASGTWLRIQQRTVPAAPEVELTGTVFNPPRFKSRASVTWRRGAWSTTAAFNYVGRETDNTGTVAIPVSSWSTVDAQLSYAVPSSVPRVLRGFRASLSVQNLFDRAPPHLAVGSTTYPGLSYDSTNASALGRFVSADLTKSW
ncbi:MAG: TonB-dependent receptor domain-containing protein, partial [Steroidobacteraceae bacterium]